MRNSLMRTRHLLRLFLAALLLGGCAETAGGREPRAPDPDPRTRQLRGVVRTTEGAPLAGARIWVRAPMSWSGLEVPYLPEQSFLAKADGSFRIPKTLPELTLQFLVTYQDYAPNEILVTPADGEPVLEVTLKEGTTLRGRILRPEGLAGGRRVDLREPSEARTRTAAPSADPRLRSERSAPCRAGPRPSNRLRRTIRARWSGRGNL